MIRKISLLINRNRVLVVLVLLGLLLRLLLMPISAHWDLLSVAYRQSLWIFNGDFKIANFSEVLLLPYMLLAKPFLLRLPEALDMSNQHGLSILQAGFEQFSHHPRAMRLIFLLKSPYILFDLLILFVGCKFFQNFKERLYFFIVWAFNPLVIYSVFIWGRYELIPILFALISLYLIKTNRNLPAIVVLGLVLVSRLSLIFIVPFVIIYLSKSLKDYLVNSSLILLPLIIWNQISVSSGRSDIVTGVASSDYGRVMFHMQVGDGFTATSLFVIVYPILLYFFYKLKNKDFNQLLVWSFVGLSAYFVFGYFNPHYPAWLSIFFLLLLPKRPKMIWQFFVFSLFYFVFIESYYGSKITWLLFMPLDQEFFPNISRLADQSFFLMYNPVLFQVIFRSLFILLLLYFSYIFIHEKQTEKKN